MISKQAKEQKMHDKIEKENKLNDESQCNYTYILGQTGVVVSIIGLYYMRKNIKRMKNWLNHKIFHKKMSIIWIRLTEIKYILVYTIYFSKQERINEQFI